MLKLINIIYNFLNLLSSKIFAFQLFLFRFLPNDKSKSDKTPNYRKRKIELPPIKIEIKSMTFDEAKAQYELKHNKPLTPIKFRNGRKIPTDMFCKCCNADHNYLYDNNGKGNSFKCKVCGNLSSPKKVYTSGLVHACPHCQKKLFLYKIWTDFDVYKCENRKCSNYLKNLNALSKQERIEHKINPSKFSLHYHTQIFKISFEDVKNYSYELAKPKTNLANIRNSAYVFGLILTYHVNHGISTRRTAQIMSDIHSVDIL